MKYPLHNRELSWLAFNQRVLQEARNPDVPLLERLKFTAIFSSNLDEYFKVRVATLRRLVKLKRKTRQKLATDPAEELRLVLEEVTRLQDEFGVTFREQILPALAAEHIHLLTDAAQLTPEQRTWAADYCREHVQPQLVVQALDQLPGPLFLKDQAVYMVFRLSGPHRAGLPQERVVVTELPTKAHGGRFVRLPDQGRDHYVAFLDDVLRVGAPDLFPDYARAEGWALKLSRDAELDIEEEVSGNLLVKIKKSLKKRETGFPARLLYDPDINPAVLMRVAERAGIGADELVEGGRYHNFRDFFGFPDLGRAHLKYPAQPALTHPGLHGRRKLLRAIAERDHLLHFPYQSFDYVLRFFRECATDPFVTAIAVTLYRVAAKSEVAKALVKAAKAGKQVTVVVELKARFDEESNIYWASKLEKAGANVIYGMPDLKVHTKMALVTRTEGDEVQQVAYLGTGNFNEVTSRLYADYALLTADPRLTREVGEVFSFLTSRQQAGRQFDHLLVAPFNLREKLTEFVETEIANARAGKPAYILLKLNALQDEGMIALLYRASQAGVEVDLNVRGISCLVPGVAGVSESIQARGLVDRYLEHGRVYLFANGGDPENERLYVASADWMNRNLSRRVEVAFPIYDPALKAEIRELVLLQQTDNVKARDFHNRLLAGELEQPRVRAQAATYDRLKEQLSTGSRA